MARCRNIFLPLLAFIVALGAVVRPARATPALRYFPETGQAVAAEILDFWQSTPSALQVLGYPISAPFIQESSTEAGTFLRVQDFERAVLEEHPAGRRILVLGRLLGNELIEHRRQWFVARGPVST